MFDESASNTADVSRLSSFVVQDGNGDLSPGFKEFLLDLLIAVAYGKLAVTDLITGIKSSIETWRSHERIQTEFCDAVWLLGTQLIPKSVEWTNLCAILKEMVSNQLIDLVKLKTSVDVGLLADIGGIGIPDEVQVKKMLVKQNTSMLYQQQKYNLMREESEGFAKLTVALSHLPSNARAAEPHIRHIFAIVGQFDLDPNRLLDVVLDAAEQNAWNPAFVALLRHFKLSHIASIVGLKFVNYHTNTTAADIHNSNNSNNESNSNGSGNNNSSLGGERESSLSSRPSTSPASLYSMTAVLLAHDLLTLEQLYPYLTPAVEVICVDMQRREQELCMKHRATKPKSSSSF